MGVISCMVRFLFRLMLPSWGQLAEQLSKHIQLPLNQQSNLWNVTEIYYNVFMQWKYINPTTVNVAHIFLISMKESKQAWLVPWSCQATGFFQWWNIILDIGQMLTFQWTAYGRKAGTAEGPSYRWHLPRSWLSVKQWLLNVQWWAENWEARPGHRLLHRCVTGVNLVKRPYTQESRQQDPVTLWSW